MYNLENFSEKTGLPCRTIRYYIQIGILPPPEGGGRGSYYTDKHLERLKIIQAWSKQGTPLFKIKELLDGSSEQVTVKDELTPEKNIKVHYLLMDGVELVAPLNIISAEQAEKIKSFINTIILGESK